MQRYSSKAKYKKAVEVSRLCQSPVRNALLDSTDKFRRESGAEALKLRRFLRSPR